MDDADRARFMYGLYAFNDKYAAPNYILRARHPDQERQSPRDLLVHIHAFCLMKNHYHILASAAQENGIPLFMKKLNMGYAKYFNEKYERTGALWQGKYRKILIEHDAHFLYIPYYIHLNPLDYGFPEWRKGMVKNLRKALSNLHAYTWSSFPDYYGDTKHPSPITSRDFLSEQLGTTRQQEKMITEIITSIGRL